MYNLLIHPIFFPTILLTVAFFTTAQTPAVITTVAGTGEPGYSGDGGPAPRRGSTSRSTAARTASGNLYVADALNHCIRRVDAQTGPHHDLAGRGEPGYSGDGGPATEARLARAVRGPG